MEGFVESEITTNGIRAVDPRTVIGDDGPVLKRDGTIDMVATFDLMLNIVADIKSSLRTVEKDMTNYFKVATEKQQQMKGILEEELASQMLGVNSDVGNNHLSDADVNIEQKFDEEATADKEHKVFDKMPESKSKLLCAAMKEETNKAVDLFINEGNTGKSIAQIPDVVLLKSKQPKLFKFKGKGAKFSIEKISHINAQKMQVVLVELTARGLNSPIEVIGCFDPGGGFEKIRDWMRILLNDSSVNQFSQQNSPRFDNNGCRLVGYGSIAPSIQISNDTFDEWKFVQTGMQNQRMLSCNLMVLATKAAQDAFKITNVDPHNAILMSWRGGAFASMQPSTVEIVVVVDSVGDMKNVAGVYGNTSDAKFHQKSKEKVPAMQLFQVFDEMPVKEMKEQEVDSPNFSDVDLFFELHEYHFRVRDPKVSSQLTPNSFLLQSVEAALVFNRFLHGRAHAQWREEPPGHENSVGSDWLIIDMQLLFHFEAQALDVAEKINKKCGPMVVRFEVLEMSISLSPWEKVDVYPCIGILKVLSKITSISRASKLRNFVKVRLLLLPFFCECYEHDQLLQIELHWVGWYIGQFVVHDFLRADKLESLTEFYNLFSGDLLMRNDNASIDLIIYIKDGCVGLALRLLHCMDSLEIQKNKLIFGEICDSCMRVGSNVPTSVALTCLVYKSMKTILHNIDTECGVHFWLTSRTPLIAPYGLMKIVSTFFFANYESRGRDSFERGVLSCTR